MFEKLITSTTAYKILKNEKEMDKLSHAYLLIFDDETMLRNALKQFAKLFFQGAFGELRRNDLIEKELFADVCIYPKENEKWSVNVSKQILDEAIIKPIEEDKKLFVLDSVQNMSPICQNKLLKILEEPPQNVQFLLGATTEQNILPTIKSRTTKFTIEPFSDEQVYSFLRAENNDSDELEEIAFASNGRIGKALSLLSNGYKELEDKAFNLALSVTNSQVIERARQYAENTNGIELFNMLRLIYADAMFYKIDKKSKIHFKRREKDISFISSFYDEGALLKASELISQAEFELNFNSMLIFELEKVLTSILEENKKWKRL